MERNITIRSTYYSTVERLLFEAGELDLIVQFTRTDPTYPVPHITEVTVNEGQNEATVLRVKAALVPLAD